MFRVVIGASAAASAAAEWSSSDDLVKVTVPVSGLKCNGNQTAWVLYPDDGNKYPLISFAHGHSAWDVPVWFPYLLEGIAKQGYVVVAAEAGTSSCSDQHYDQIRCLQWALKESDLLPHIDVDAGTGIGGHSMGGGSTITSASDADAIAAYNIKAAVAMHPSSGRPNAPQIPILYLTGTTDTVVSPAGVFKQYQAASSSVAKTFANVVRATHTDACGYPGVSCPAGSPFECFNMEDAYSWDTFACHLKGDQSACARVSSCTVANAVNGSALAISQCEHNPGTAKMEFV